MENVLADYEKTLQGIRAAGVHLLVGYVLIPLYIGIPLQRRSKSKIRTLTGKKLVVEDKLIRLSKNTLQDALDAIGQVRMEDTYLLSQRLYHLLEILESRSAELSSLYSKRELFDASLNKSVADSLTTVLRVSEELGRYNAEFVERKKKQYEELWKKSPIKLDDNQLNAIVKDDKHNLIVAGAGSGKTEVLITRIAYLTERKPDRISPDRILALAYQEKAAREIRTRLEERFHSDVKVKTFHALGREIVSTHATLANLAPPQTAFSKDNDDKEHQQFVKEIYDRLMANGDFQNDVMQFMQSYPDSFLPKDASDFATKEEYYAYIRNLRYVALDNTKVKSEAEREILNFFIMHEFNGQRIQVRYESPAEWMRTMDNHHRDPRPDFFFPEFNLYLEHWGLDKQGRVPTWFDQTTEQYKQGMKLKKMSFARQNHFGLIETYSWEYYEEGFLDKVRERFLDAVGGDTKLTRVPYEKLVNTIWWECRKNVEALPSNISKFIKIAKTYNLSPEDIRKRISSKKWSQKQKAFGKVAVRVFQAYQETLEQKNMIDFQDMINDAVRILNNSPKFLQGAYDQILIDEYQDVSQQRYELIKAIMAKNPRCKLFCVGDDWQSIMGFSGANMDLFVNFADHFDHPTRTDLTVNYRSTKSIVDTGAMVIAQNGPSQLQKKTIANNQKMDRVKVYAIRNNQDSYYRERMARHCVDAIIGYLTDGYKEGELMVLYRARNFDLLNKLKSYAAERNISFMSDGKSHKGVPLLTVHKSKGLEARVVFILDAIQDLYGFPCEIQNPDVLEPAKVQVKQDKEEEERRLFYVAVTRAKEKVLIYTQQRRESKFLTEIQEATEREILQ
jgi:DNA helicase IV